MAIEILINNSSNASANYVAWSPSPCTIRETNPPGGTNPIRVTLRNRASTVGRVVFMVNRNGPEQTSIQLNLPANGNPLTFFVAGEFGSPSVNDRDAAIEVLNNAGSSVLVKQLMVRIRKNANSLTAGERNRFLSAFASLNNAGTGRFRDFRNMHLANSELEGHRNAGFLPWHRAYLLDLERELQAIDRSVTLPFWRFDQPAPNVFNRAFMGISNSSGRVEFNSSNPLSAWSTDGVVGVTRSPLFNTTTGRPSGMNEASTMGLGSNYSQFDNMETNPHGSAHTSFNGFLRSLGSAARDPLFFLLHCNVDRLWAKWQWNNNRFNTSSTSSYPFLGQAGGSGATRVGHNLRDSMWPWNGVTSSPRPSTAPGGTFPGTATTTAPGTRPEVGQMIDFQGVNTAARRLAFDYADTPYEFPINT